MQTTLVDKRSKIMADIRTSQLVVLCTEREMDSVNKLVERLDTPTKQVLIEAKLLETTVSPSTTKGINWAGTLGGQNIRFGNGSTYQLPPTAPVLGSGTNPEPPCSRER